MLVRTPTIGGQKRLITPFGSGAPKVHRVPGGGGLTDTFLMARRQTLWPQLATATSGTWYHTANVNCLFGGWYQNDSAAGGDYLEWANVVLQPGTYTVKILGFKSNNRGNLSLSFDGVDTGADFDFYDASALANQIVSDTFTVATKTRGPIRLTSDSGFVTIQQIEIVKTSADSDAGSSLDDLPWHGHCPAFSIDSAEYNNGGWIDYKSTITPTQTTSAQWGSYIPISHATYDWRVKYKFWCPQGTHTLNLRHLTGTSGGTITALVNDGATTPTTFSTSAGSTNYNVSTDLTFTAASTGMQTLELSGSGGVTCPLQWISWRKTSAIGAITATGATYGVESLELWPWFADSGSDYDTFTLGSSYLYYGIYFRTNGAAGASLRFANNGKPGTYDLELISPRYSYYGIVALSEDGGSTLDTVDLYGTLLNNQKFVLTGALTGGVVYLDTDTKNPSSIQYYSPISQIRATRTGA